jgi:hypothetical protein
MPWFRHHYYCERYDGSWLAEAELVIDGDCPFCGARDTAPYKSDDWSLVIEPERDKFVVLELSNRRGSSPTIAGVGRLRPAPRRRRLRPSCARVSGPRATSPSAPPAPSARCA